MWVSRHYPHGWRNGPRQGWRSDVGREGDDARESRTGWKIRRAETSEKGESLLLFVYLEKHPEHVLRGCQP